MNKNFEIQNTQAMASAVIKGAEEFNRIMSYAELYDQRKLDAENVQKELSIILDKLPEAKRNGSVIALSRNTSVAADEEALNKWMKKYNKAVKSLIDSGKAKVMLPEARRAYIGIINEILADGLPTMSDFFNMVHPKQTGEDNVDEGCTSKATVPTEKLKQHLAEFLDGKRSRAELVQELQSGRWVLPTNPEEAVQLKQVLGQIVAALYPPCDEKQDAELDEPGVEIPVCSPENPDGLTTDEFQEPESAEENPWHGLHCTGCPDKGNSQVCQCCADADSEENYEDDDDEEDITDTIYHLTDVLNNLTMAVNTLQQKIDEVDNKTANWTESAARILDDHSKAIADMGATISRLQQFTPPVNRPVSPAMGPYTSGFGPLGTPETTANSSETLTMGDINISVGGNLNLTEK